MRFLVGMRVRSDLAVVAVLLATIMLMVIPLPTLVVDVLLAFNIGLSVLLLLTAFYLHTPVQFSTLPSVILIATVFRLSLSIAVTRLVLVQADAGSIIRTFGDFVVAGNVVIGLVIFLIITVVQFIVITKGAERVAEVAARFTLDAMPGKQMAIDADLRSGDIDQAAARGRRRTLERESQLYGAMDGAMKFVKGDAIAGLIIIAVNLLGGLAIGVLQNGMSLGDAAHTYSILTIGDGLVAQIPALFISITAGTVVTRVGGGEGDSLGGEIAAQISKDSRALWLAAGMTAVMGLVPGFPTVVFLLISAGLALLARAATRRDAIAAEPLPLPAIPTAPSRLRLFLPAALYEAAGPLLAGLLSRHATALSEELGIAIPATEIIPPGVPSTPRGDTFRLELDGVPIAEGTVPAGQLLLADDADVADLAGVAAHPGAPLPGRPDTLWAPVAERPRLLAAGLGFLSPAEIVAGVVPVVLRRHAGQLIGIQEARQMLSSAEASWGDLVREAQRVLPLQRMADLFRRLLDDGLALRNLRGLLEAVIEYAPREQDAALLAEAVRSTLRRQICYSHADQFRMIAAFVIDAEAEAALRGAVANIGGSMQLNLAPGTATALVERIRAEDANSQGAKAVVLTAPDLRRHLRSLLANNGVYAPVLAFHDLMPDFNVQPLGTVRMAGAAVVIEHAPVAAPAEDAAIPADGPRAARSA